MSNNPAKSNRPSSGDYPVNPEERSNQQERLRKAAAAGASASKSPISALRLQSPSSNPTAPNIPAPQTTAPEKIAPAEAAPQTSVAPGRPPMIDGEVLAELRKLSAWADAQRKLTKWLLGVGAGLVPVIVIIFMALNRLPNSNAGTNPSAPPADLFDVDRNLRTGDIDKAIAIGEELIQKMPQSPEAHQHLARAYLAAGNLEKAKQHFAEAFRLFPSEENEKLVGAIDKRIRADSP